MPLGPGGSAPGPAGFRGKRAWLDTWFRGKRAVAPAGPIAVVLHAECSFPAFGSV